MEDGDLALFVGNGQVLASTGGAASTAASAGRRRHDAHGDATQHVGGNELADLLALVAAVIHANVFKGAFLRAWNEIRIPSSKINMIKIEFFKPYPMSFL